MAWKRSVAADSYSVGGLYILVCPQALEVVYFKILTLGVNEQVFICL